MGHVQHMTVTGGRYAHARYVAVGYGVNRAADALQGFDIHTGVEVVGAYLADVSGERNGEPDRRPVVFRAVAFPGGLSAGQGARPDRDDEYFSENHISQSLMESVFGTDRSESFRVFCAGSCNRCGTVRLKLSFRVSGKLRPVRWCGRSTDNRIIVGTFPFTCPEPPAKTGIVQSGAGRKRCVR